MLFRCCWPWWLFQPYDRLGAEETDVQGTGMGLAKGLVEAMDGTLVAESVEGQGATFTVELPAATAPVESGAAGRA